LRRIEGGLSIRHRAGQQPWHLRSAGLFIGGSWLCEPAADREATVDAVGRRWLEERVGGSSIVTADSAVFDQLPSAAARYAELVEVWRRRCLAGFLAPVVCAGRVAARWLHAIIYR